MKDWFAERIRNIAPKLKCMYGTEMWDHYFGGEEGLTTYLLWTLSEKHCKLKDPINGLTLEQVNITQ